MTFGNEFGRSLVIVIGYGLVAVPEDRLRHVAGQRGGGRNDLHHLAKLVLQALGSRVAQGVPVNPGQAGKTRDLNS